MSISDIPSSNISALVGSASVVINEGAAGKQAGDKGGEGSIQNLWKFGSSTFRVGSDGNIRPATEEEIESEIRSNPSAMVKVLSTGADLLRFDANGEYTDKIELIALVHQDTSLSSDEIASRIRELTEELRTDMRNDIKSGKFTVNDSGQIFHNGVAVPPEVIGFEMNALLIESITDRTGELITLKDQLATINKFIKDNVDEDNKVVALFDVEERILIESREEKDRNGKGSIADGTFNTSHRRLDDNASNAAIAADVQQFRIDTERESDLDIFVKEKFPDFVSTTGSHGADFMEQLREKFEKALEGSGLAASEWFDKVDDTDIKTVGNTISMEELGMVAVQTTSGTFQIDRSEVYRGKNQEKETNRLSIGGTVFDEAIEKISTRESTLGTLTQQIGTNFSLDNTRFNNLIEAMNSYNTSVVDSLRRFAIV